MPGTLGNFRNKNTMIIFIAAQLLGVEFIFGQPPF